MAWIAYLIAALLSIYQGNCAKNPTFSTPSSTIQAVVGDTVLLPCSVLDLGGYLLAWKRGIAVLTAGNIKVSPDERLRLVEDYDLEIRSVQESDAGDYVCQIATIQPKEISHTLQVLVPPRIEGFTPEGVLEVDLGNKLQVDCHASGHPAPAVSWTKQGNRKSAGPRLEINNVQRQDAGIYLCTANNGVRNAASTQLELNVLYPPEVNVSNSWIHAGAGSSANLSCAVASYPPAQVTWYRETKPLTPTERTETRSSGHEYWLMLHHIKEDDLGPYFCVAENSKGKEKGTIELSGRPHRAIFQSSPEGRLRDRYNISWTVTSLTPIEEFKLLFRKSARSMSTHSTTRYFRKFDGNATSPSSSLPSSMTTEQQEDWNEIVLQASPKEHLSHETHFTLQGLEPATTYEALVQAKNRFGWSQISDTFHFVTRGLGGDMFEPSEPSLLHEPEVRGMGVRALESSSVGCTVQIPGTITILLIYAGVTFGT